MKRKRAEPKNASAAKQATCMKRAKAAGVERTGRLAEVELRSREANRRECKGRRENSREDGDSARRVFCPKCGMAVESGIVAGDGREQKPRTAEDSQMVKVWDGEIDARAANDTLLDLIRRDEGRHERSHADMARRYKFTRQHARKLMETSKVLTIWLFQKWCNGRRLNAAFVYARAIACIRANIPRRGVAR